METDQQDEAENGPEREKEAAGRRWIAGFLLLAAVGCGIGFYMENI